MTMGRFGLIQSATKGVSPANPKARVSFRIPIDNVSTVGKRDALPQTVIKRVKARVVSKVVVASLVTKVETSWGGNKGWFGGKRFGKKGGYNKGGFTKGGYFGKGKGQLNSFDINNFEYNYGGTEQEDDWGWLFQLNSVTRVNNEQSQQQQ